MGGSDQRSELNPVRVQEEAEIAAAGGILWALRQFDEVNQQIMGVHIAAREDQIDGPDIEGAVDVDARELLQMRRICGRYLLFEAGVLMRRRMTHLIDDDGRVIFECIYPDGQEGASISISDLLLIAMDALDDGSPD